MSLFENEYVETHVGDLCVYRDRTQVGDIVFITADNFKKYIPIEWLHSIMEKQLIFAMESEMEGTTTVQDGVIHCVSGAVACQVLANVIELWEKENGKGNTNS